MITRGCLYKWCKWSVSAETSQIAARRVREHLEQDHPAAAEEKKIAPEATLEEPVMKWTNYDRRWLFFFGISPE